jgi:nucleoside-diphosphate-sugar epimerase
VRSIVTGGSGFIGTHLLKHLIKRGEEPISIDRQLPPVYSKPHEFHRIDLNDGLTLHQQEELNNYDKIYHLAADSIQTNIDDEWLKKTGYLMFNNSLTTHYIVCKFHKPDHFVFTSSAAVYGEVKDARENHPIDIMNPYGYSKHVAEAIVTGANFPSWSIFRPGTVVGPYGRTFPNRLVWCAVNEKPVKIFNKGENIRSFIDVRDVCQAMIASENSNPGIYNLSFESYQYKEVAKCVLDLCGLFDCPPLEYKFIDYVPQGLVKKVSLNNEKLLDWYEPTITMYDSIKDMFENYLYTENHKQPPNWGE